MASFSQNLVRYEHDGDFKLIYTVTNAGTTLGITDYCAVWMLLNADNVADSTSVLKLARTAGGATYNNSINTTGCTASTTNLDTVSSDLSIAVGNTTVTVDWTFTEFASLGTGDYYHELILLDRVTNVCYQCRSQVVATGVLTINESLFTNRSYR